ncbi:Hypothetical protein, putative [Bodo saltans]|uniref:EF-hand domain-containing protein n=1 Tax=Bodo saltans TaxID=75058 RepID=A0A0S4JSA2_BODSA|nr:Hypothetical protein, putative [Bodo saltans]|eukprot:CUG92855.1 Hypothetical protein, putative [Bodo saltans]
MSSRTSSCAHKLHYFLADTFSSFFFIRSHKEIMSRGQLQSGAGSSNSNAYSLDLTSLAPGKALLTIPSLSRGSECVITVRLSKADTDITVLCPYFEAYTPASSGALAAADALRVKQPATPPEEGPPTAYVSEFQHNNAGLNMYFAVSPHEATNLTSYDWVECLSHSRGQRFSRPPISASSPLKAPTESQGGKLIGVGAPEEEDGVEEGCQTTAGAGTSSKEHDSSKSLIPLSTTAATDNGVVFGISNVRNVFYIALHAPVTLRHVEVTILSHVPLRAQDDIRHPLRMCRLHHVTGETYDTAVEWITRKRTSLQQGLLSLTQDGCEAPLGSSKRRGPDGAPLPESRRTFLHVIAENLGDPRFARMLVKHCSRFLRKDEKDVATHRTALQTLFLTPLSSSSSSSSTVKDWYARTVDAFSAGYYRMLELLRLLVEEVQVSLDEEDCLGNTAVHYAACGHRRGSELLPILLMMGAPPASINLDGHTPKQELLLRQRQQGLMTWDVDEALALLEKYTDQPFAPVAMGDDSITSAPSSRAAAQPQDSASVDAVALLVAAPQSLNHEASVAAALQKRRDDVAVHIGQGVDLPRVPLKLVDVVPLKVRPLGADAIRAFPTPAIDVDETGYPAHKSKHHAVMDDVISSRGGDALETTTTASEGLMPTRTMAGDDGDDDGSHHNRGSISDATLKLLRAEFNALDHDSEGWIPVSDMRRVYLSYDGYGVAESTAEIDKMISVMGIRKDGKVTFDEYCILMLRMNRL